MDIIPILSTVILIATIVTLIVAITSYVVFRVKERQKSRGGSAQHTNTEESGHGVTTPYLPGQGAPAITKPGVVKGADLAPASQNNVVEDEYEEEYSEDDFEDETDEEPEEELSAAQAAFMHSMRSAIGEHDKGGSGRRSAPPADSLKMRRFKISKNNDESIGNDEENGRSLWR